MRVVYESDIFNRIKEIVNTANRNILLVEMNNDEFSELLDDIFVTGVVDRCAFEAIDVSRPLNHNGHSGYDWSCSCVVYKGVCFQTHSSYNH